MEAKQEKISLLRLVPFGVLAGFLSGVFGAGGGVVAVPALRRVGFTDSQACATALSVTLPLALAGGFLYLQAGALSFGEALPYLPGGIIGAVVGAKLLPRLKATWLRRIFGGTVLFLAGRLLLR